MRFFFSLSFHQQTENSPPLSDSVITLQNSPSVLYYWPHIPPSGWIKPDKVFLHPVVRRTRIPRKKKKHTRTHIVCGLEISRGQFDKAHPPTHNKTHAHKVCTHLYALHSSSLNSSLLLSRSPLDTLLRTHTHIQTPHTHTNRRHTHQQKSDYPEILESAERSTEQVWLICLK